MEDGESIRMIRDVTEAVEVVSRNYRGTAKIRFQKMAELIVRAIQSISVMGKEKLLKEYAIQTLVQVLNSKIVFNFRVFRQSSFRY